MSKKLIDSEDLQFKDLSLLEKFLLPIGVFSAGFALGSTYIHNPPYDIIAALVMIPSILGTSGSLVYRMYQENKNYVKGGLE